MAKPRPARLESRRFSSIASVGYEPLEDFDYPSGALFDAGRVLVGALVAAFHPKQTLDAYGRELGKSLAAAARFRFLPMWGCWRRASICAAV